MSSYLRTASRVLAAALSECLPGLQIQDVGETTGGVYCDFISPYVHDQLLSQLEERIRQIVREKKPIRVVDMVPFSAAELLKKEGQKARAAQVLEQEGLVQMVQINSFTDWSEGAHLKEAEGLFKLIECKQFSKNFYRVFGFVASSKEALKERLIQWKTFPERSHLFVGERDGLWEEIEGKWIWFAKGLKARRQMEGFFRKQFSPLAIEVEGDLRFIKKKKELMHLMQFLPADSPFGERGLLDSTARLQLFSFGKNESSSICLLQTIHKSLTILGFTVRIRLLGRSGLLASSLKALNLEPEEREQAAERPGIEFLVEDPMGSEWVFATLVDEKEMIRLTVWVERNLALLLERNGDLLIAGDEIEN